MSRVFPEAPESFPHMICSALQNALEVEMPEIYEEHNIVERLGSGQFRWNLIISNLQSRCKWFGLCKRGAWKVPVVYYPEADLLVTLMTNDHLKDVQRAKGKGMHYLCAASSWNCELIAQEEQLAMDLPQADIDTSWIKKSQKQLAECVEIDPCQVKGHVLIAFSCKMDKVTSVRAVRLTPNLEISTEEESWDTYLNQPYCSETIVLPENLLDDDDEQLVEIK